VLELLVEGGPTLQASLWAAGLADRLVWYLAPPGHRRRRRPGLLGGAGAATLADARRLRLASVDRLGDGPAAGRLPAQRGGRVMFTGIVEGTGTVAVLAVAADAGGARLEVEAPWLAGQLALGESVAVNGCCVTVAEPTTAGFAADLVAETLRRTALGGLEAGPGQPGAAAGLGGRLGGHLVQGTSTGSRRCWTERPWARARRCESSSPGAGALCRGEGVDRRRRGQPDRRRGSGPGGSRSPWCPTPWRSPPSGTAGPGDPVQLEVDVVAKYIERLVVRQ
jgi:riboflavin synthase